MSTSAKHRSYESEQGRASKKIRIRDTTYLNMVFGFLDPLRILWDPISETFDAGPLYPAWVPVEDETPVVLEGVVVKGDEQYPYPDVSYEDFPTHHYTHDFNFAVRPDPAYTNLLGIQVTADKPESEQEEIDIEWETGLGAGNDGNLLSGPNKRGDSGGFYSEGHRRRQVIWNWPATGDRVHIEGLWIWDRAHPPARTEIHPPRLVAIQRKLPAAITIQRPRQSPILAERVAQPDAGPAPRPRPGGDPPPDPGPPPPPPDPGPDPTGDTETAMVLATQIDIFASGDGGALWNNRQNVPQFVKWVPMNDRDYAFMMYHPLPPPSPTAQLRWIVSQRAGDTFPSELDIRPIRSIPPVRGSIDTLNIQPAAATGTPDQADHHSHPAPVTHHGSQQPPLHLTQHEASAQHELHEPVLHATGSASAVPGTLDRSTAPGVQVTIPWKRDGIADEMVLARTIYLYWDEGSGVPANYPGRSFRVTLKNVHIVKSLDEGDGEYRLFVEAGGNWLFVNELPGDDDILNDGLGDTGDDATWNIGRQFTVYVPPGENFRIHAGGWEADGVNDLFGRILDPDSTAEQLEDWFNDNLFTLSVKFNGCNDDPIGEVNDFISIAEGEQIPAGDQVRPSMGPIQPDAGCGETDPGGAYTLRYQIEEVQPFWVSPEAAIAAAGATGIHSGTVLHEHELHDQASAPIPGEPEPLRRGPRSTLHGSALGSGHGAPEPSLRGPAPVHGAPDSMHHATQPGQATLEPDYSGTAPVPRGPELHSHPITPPAHDPAHAPESASSGHDVEPAHLRKPPDTHTGA